MDGIELKNRLDLAARVGAVALVALYGAGFLVVSIHNAWYGIVEFGLFRTKLLSAGIVFAIFFAIPFMETCKIYGLFGIEPWKPAQQIGFGSSPFWKWSAKLFVFFTAAWVTSYVLRTSLLDDHPYLRVSGWFSVAAFGIPVVVGVSVGSGILRNKVYGTLLTVLAFAAIAILIIELLHGKEFVFATLIGWFALVGWLTHEMHTPIREPVKLVEVRWDIAVVNVVSLFTLFGGWIYPKIGVQFGGGRPSRVALQFVGVSPVDNSSKMEVWLVDETDDGYYFVRAPEDRKAIFVPRSFVSAVYFQGDNPTQ